MDASPQQTTHSIMQRRLGQEVTKLQAQSDIVDHTYRVQSQLPIIGPLIAWARRNLTSHLREPYMDPALTRQVAFNQHVVQFLGQLVTTIERTGDEDLAFDISGLSYDSPITEADIVQAYRLILGRHPDKFSWQHYTARIGEMHVSDLAADLLTSREFKDHNVFFQLVGDHREEAPIWVDLGDYGQYVTLSDESIGQTILEHKIWEPIVTAQLRSRLRPGDVVLDIGANIGYHTLLAAHCVGQVGRVIALEPNQHNCNQIWLSALQNRFENIELFPLAAADRSATFIFDLRKGSNGVLVEEVNSLDNRAVAQLLKRTLVRAMKIDDLLHNLERLDVIKIDIEGAEYRALRGAEALLRRHQPIILTEFAPLMLQHVSQCSGEEYLKWLIHLGYHLSVLGPDVGQQIDCQDDCSAVMKLCEETVEGLLDLLAVPVD